MAEREALREAAVVRRGSVPSHPIPVMISRLSLLVVALVATGCASTASFAPQPGPEPEPFALVAGATLDEAAVSRLLDAEVRIPRDASMAVLQIPGSARGRSYFFANVDPLEARETTLNVLRGQMLGEGRVGEIEMLPGLLAPATPDVPVLREIAVRLQADLLLVFRARGDLYQADRIFRADRFDARATCEAVLLDVRTGAFPFTTVVTRQVETVKQRDDLTDAAARTRAVQQAEQEAVSEMARQVAAFLDREQAR